MKHSEVICAYTRADAIADGQQFCLSDAMPEECRTYKYPVYVTSGVWSLVEAAAKNPDSGCDYKGVVWDLMWMSRRAVKERWGTGVKFSALVADEEGTANHKHDFVMECGPRDIDDPTPVLTLMLPEER